MRRLILMVCLLLLGARGASGQPTIGFVNADPDEATGVQEIAAWRAWLTANHPKKASELGAHQTTLESAPARETAALARADEHLAAARAALSRLDKTGVMIAVDASGAALSHIPLTNEVTARLADGQLLIARALAAGTDKGAMQQALQAAKRLRPTYKLDPAEYRPSLVKLYEKPEVKNHTLKLRLRPAAASAAVDGVPTDSPIVSVGEGIHFVSVSAPDHQAVIRRIEVTQKSQSLEVALKPLPLDEQLLALRSSAQKVEARPLVAKRIAELTSASALVIVSGGKAQLYRTKQKTLDKPYAISDAGVLFAPLFGQSVPPEALGGRTEARAEKKSWVWTWWGQTIIWSSALAVTGGIVYAVTREDDSTFDVTNICFAGGC